MLWADQLKKEILKNEVFIIQNYLNTSLLCQTMNYSECETSYGVH